MHVDSPFERTAMMGPLLNKEAFDIMNTTIDQAKVDGGIVTGGERLSIGHFEKAYYVSPCIIELEKQTPTMLYNILAPILYVVKYDDIDEAIAEINRYENTLVSCLFTNDLKKAGYFTSTKGVKSETTTINAGSLGSLTKIGLTGNLKDLTPVEVGTISFDVASMFNAGKNGALFSTSDNAWQTFMQVKTCLLNFNNAD